MTELKPYVGDVGTVIEAETGVDLSSVATLEMRMVKPDGTTTTWTAAKKAADNSIAQYTIKTGEFSLVGVWFGQIYAKWDVNNIWFGRTFSFELFAIGA